MMEEKGCSGSVRQWVLFYLISSLSKIDLVKTVFFSSYYLKLSLRFLNVS